MVKQSSKLDAVFGTLSDPTRRKILERLARGELTAGELAAGFDLSQSAISKHAKILEVSGLAKRKVSGRNHHFRLAPRAMTPASTWIQTQRAFWERSFDRIETLLAEEGSS